MKTNPDDPIAPQVTDPENSVHFGLTKREYFAACALQGAMANPALDCFERPDQLAYIAVARADALIAELNEETE